MTRRHSEDVTLGMLGLAETLGVYGNLCSSVDDLKAKARQADPNIRADLNAAYLRSGGLSLAIAGAAWALTGSLAPLGGWLLGTGLALVTYETTLPPSQRLTSLDQLFAAPVPALPSAPMDTAANMIIDCPASAWRELP